MSRTPDAVYRGYDIFTVAVPDDGELWSATSEIVRNGANGIEISQGFGGPCQAHSSEEAKNLVIADTRHKIDDLLAEP